MDRIPLNQVKHRYLYRLHSRNLEMGVFNSEVNGYVGIRTKFGSRFLDCEFDWDTGAPHGTATPVEELGALPEDIPISPNNNNELFKWLEQEELRPAISPNK